MKKAFTLIELLVVIAIISILAAMLLPALKRARDSAREAKCISNHKQFSLAYQMYLGSNSDYVIRGVAYFEPVVGKKLIYNNLANYGARMRWLDPGAMRKPTNNKDWWHYGYAGYWNPSVPGAKWPSITNGLTLPFPVTKIRNPSTTFMFMCKLPMSPPQTGSVHYTGCLMLFYGGGGAYMPWALHDMETSTNVARFDGSVRNYRWTEIVPHKLFNYYMPPGHTGLYNSTPREYLWTGYKPGEGSRGGWLGE